MRAIEIKRHGYMCTYRCCRTHISRTVIMAQASDIKVARPDRGRCQPQIRKPSVRELRNKPRIFLQINQ